jgi:hypothetical protein
LPLTRAINKILRLYEAQPSSVRVLELIADDYLSDIASRRPR